MGRFNMAIKKTKTKLNDANLAFQDKVFIFISRKAYAYQMVMDWKNRERVQWSKYQIKETDMRTKTATFTTNQYLDLTTGQYCVLITSPYHEDFAGVILSVEYDDKNGLYTYQCQDWGRHYQTKVEIMLGTSLPVYNILRNLVSLNNVPLNEKHKDFKKMSKMFKKSLSGLRPAWQYWEPAWGGIIKNYNPMTVNKKVIIRNKSFMDAIRDIVFGLGRFIDVYFDKYGVLHIEPFVKDEWLHTGLCLTTPEIASAKYKFDTTNVITGAIVHNADKTKQAGLYQSKDIINLNLWAFFGVMTTSIDNPNTQTTTKTTSNNKNNKKVNKTKKKVDNVYGTRKKRVYLNIDSIYGYSSDMKKMKDIRKVLQKNGWEVTIVGVGSEAHWERRGDVHGGIWFCLYGGVCGGTLHEHCDSDWFLNPLKKHHSRVVVGIFPPASSIKKGGKYYKHLVPAHDWNGSQSYAHLDYPGRFMSRAGVPWMYADNGKEMASKFLAGGDNYDTEGNSYKWYDSWQKHQPKWL